MLAIKSDPRHVLGDESIISLSTAIEYANSSK